MSSSPATPIRAAPPNTPQRGRHVTFPICLWTSLELKDNNKAEVCPRNLPFMQPCQMALGRRSGPVFLRRRRATITIGGETLS
jgi:hypothetical protein